LGRKSVPLRSDLQIRVCPGTVAQRLRGARGLVTRSTRFGRLETGGVAAKLRATEKENGGA
jgi:hypothetical protein